MSGLKKYRTRAAALVAEMTNEEKADLVSGFSMWETREVPRLGLKKVDVSDGPHGVRKQLDYYDIGVDESVQTVGFPAGCCIASSWDVGAIYEMGKALGENAKTHGISLLLGPGVNIKRSPLCGRNFEYFSEDPHLSGALAAGYIRGLQSTGVSACVKHFAGNNQETRRLSINSIIDERALREIYLPAFFTAINEAEVDTVMAAYNTLNGNSCSQNYHLLTDLLRNEWGFDGMVVSDWGAVTDDVAAVAAGNDLKMPGFEQDPARIVKALADGSLTETALDKAAINVTAFLLKSEDLRENDSSWGKEEDLVANHRLARRLATESIVLLKNDGVLPLGKAEKLLIVGKNAINPHFQGGGSSHVNVYKIDSSVEEFKQNDWNYDFFEDFSDNEILKTNCKTAIVFAGTPESEESEGFDRTTLDLPTEQNDLIFALCKKGLRVVVVLFEGSGVTMPWVDEVAGILTPFLPGESGGGAVFDVLTGAVNPSGKLAETLATKIEDVPSYLYFPGQNDNSFYGESIFVGYRYFDKKKVEPLFPFGHGLSYTSFSYANPKVEKTEYSDDEPVNFSVDITNIGKLAGKEIIQVYVEPLEPKIIRPIRELRAFKKVFLVVGETKTIDFKLGYKDFSYYDVDNQRFVVETGAYRIIAAASSSDLRASTEVIMKSTFVAKRVFTRDSLLGDLKLVEGGEAVLDSIIKQAGVKLGGENAPIGGGDDEAFMKMVMSMPIKTLILLGMEKVAVDTIIADLNRRQDV